MASASMVLTAAIIASATGGHLRAGDPDRAVDGFAIDSRSLQPGDLFFAIVAGRDGHAFVADAIARGASGAVVSAPVAGVGDDALVIHVADTTAALQELGRYVRRMSKAALVAITGSAGKTTTKETIAEFLSMRHRVIRNRGNLNNHLGLPLSLLELRRGADVAVMELGMNHAGEIRRLVEIAEPDVRVWTNVGDAHLGHFGSREEIADAKAEILEYARARDVLVCNADDALVLERARSFAGRTLTFGTATSADIRAVQVIDRGLEGSEVEVVTRRGRATLHVPLLGAGNVSNVLAAAAVALEFDITLEQIAERTPQLRPAAHRGSVVRLPHGITIVDDSYNSSPSALLRALAVIANTVGNARRAAVLGEMLELGAHADRLHQECGRAAAAAKLDRLVAVGGPPAQVLASSAIAAGLDAHRVTWVASSAEAADLIVRWLRPGDVVLVKGSRGIKTDVVVDRISEELG